MFRLKSKGTVREWEWQKLTELSFRIRKRSVENQFVGRGSRWWDQNGAHLKIQVSDLGKKKKKEEEDALSVLVTKKKKLDLLNAFFLEREREEREREREWNGLVLYSFKHKGADSWTFKPYRLNLEQVLLIWTVMISTRGLFCSDFLLGLFFKKFNGQINFFSISFSFFFILFKPTY